MGEAHSSLIMPLLLTNHHRAVLLSIWICNMCMCEREVWMGIGAAVRPPGRKPAWDSRCPCASWQASPPICGGAASVQWCQLALRSAQARFTRGNLQLDQTDLNMLLQGMMVSIYISSIGKYLLHVLQLKCVMESGYIFVEKSKVTFGPFGTYKLTKWQNSSNYNQQSCGHWMWRNNNPRVLWL